MAVGAVCRKRSFLLQRHAKQESQRLRGFQHHKGEILFFFPVSSPITLGLSLQRRDLVKNSQPDESLQVELSTNSMRLAGKASVPAGGPFVCFLPAVGPAVGPFVTFWAIVCKCFISCCRSVFSKQQLLLETPADFNPNFVWHVWCDFQFFCAHTVVPQRRRRSFQRHRQPPPAATVAPATAGAGAAAAAAVGVYCVCFEK